MTAQRFNPLKADAHWQKVWEERGTFRARDDSAKPKAYILEMFPYPSGRIHMGHVRNYTMGDVLARFRRMQGCEVLHPMGWDAFGMPAENAAMEKKVHPGAWTRQNIATMRAQLKRLGFALDWSRELATCEPDYYGHEQALFLDMFEAGLVYRKESEVNWDPVDMTVLANEQVIDGRGWRSNALVERRKLSQWFLKITDFADELLDGLHGLDRWPDKVRLMQENWIGKSRGMRFRFQLTRPVGGHDGFEVFTTRPDTIFGSSFAALSPDHPIALAIAEPGSGGGRVHRRVQARRDHRGRAGDRGEEGLRHRPDRRPPARSGMAAAGLHRQFRADGLWHRRDLRGAGARPARLRIRQQIRAADPARGGGLRRARRARRSRARPTAATACWSIRASSTACRSKRRRRR